MSTRVFEIAGVTTPDIFAASEIEIIIPQAAGELACIEIIRVMARQDSGSATEYQVSIGNQPGYVEYSMEQKYLGSAALSSETFDESDVAAFGNTSEDGKIYLRFTPNSGADNQFSYAITYKI